MPCRSSVPAPQSLPRGATISQLFCVVSWSNRCVAVHAVEGVQLPTVFCARRLIFNSGVAFSSFVCCKYLQTSTHIRRMFIHMCFLLFRAFVTCIIYYLTFF